MRLGRVEQELPMSPRPGESWISRSEAEASFQALREQLATTRRLLEDLGVRVPPASRFDEYGRELDRLALVAAAEQSYLTSEDRHLLQDVILECQQFLPNVSELARPPEVAGWRDIAARAIGGHTSAGSESASTPGRDAQVELYVGGLGRRAGYGVRFAEPDVILERADEVRLAIAVKRVKTAEALPKRLHAGNTQLRRAGCQGVVAIQLGFFARQVIREREMATALEILRGEVRGFAARRLRELCKCVDLDWCFGLILLASKPAFLRTGLAVVSSIYSCNLCSEFDPRCRVLEGLMERLPREP
jgi:hypothetical protein